MSRFKKTIAVAVAIAAIGAGFAASAQAMHGETEGCKSKTCEVER